MAISGCGGDDDAAALLRGFRLPELVDLAMTVQTGLRHGHAPRQGGGGGSGRRGPGLDYGRLVEGYCGGTYVMSNATGAACAVFKPADEEPYAPLNRKARRAGGATPPRVPPPRSMSVARHLCRPSSLLSGGCKCACGHGVC